LEAANYDLIVAGAGPAGSACAITAAQAGARVLLLEKDRFPRHKVCGEFVSPESLGLLQRLLGGTQFNTRPEINSSRVFVDKKTVSLPVAPAARSIPRFELDALLFQATQSAGVQAEEGITIREVLRQNDVFSVVTANNTFTAKAVVNATGRWSQLTQYEVNAKERWIGLKAHFAEEAPPQSVDLYFFSGGYCGVQPVAANAVNAAAMVRADAARSLEEVFARHPELWRRSRDWQPLFPTITTSPLYFRKPETESRGMMLAGDAAGFIDPFAGDGISLALHSGTVAAETLVPFFEAKCSLNQAHQQYGESYQKRFAPAFRNAARLRFALSAPAWLRSGLIGLAGLRSVAGLVVRGTRARPS
jgi:flavin-dependent dehydrogenase